VAHRKYSGEAKDIAFISKMAARVATQHIDEVIRMSKEGPPALREPLVIADFWDERHETNILTWAEFSGKRKYARLYTELAEDFKASLLKASGENCLYAGDFYNSEKEYTICYSMHRVPEAEFLQLPLYK
jgi:hypothetical protein